MKWFNECDASLLNAGVRKKA